MEQRSFTSIVVALAIMIQAATAAAAGQRTGSSDDWENRLASLDRGLPEWMAEASLPGLALAVVSSDSLWIQTYGVTDADAGGPPVRPETLFEAASLSKPLFARMVLMEAKRGTIHLDTPLAEYWEYPDLGDEPWSDRITARMVLSHRSGLPNWRRDQPLTIEFEPGERFQYSGEGYVLLEQTLAHLRGEVLEDRAEEMVIDPVGMARSSFLFALGDSDHATPHDEEGQPQDKRAAEAPGNLLRFGHQTLLPLRRHRRRPHRSRRPL